MLENIRFYYYYYLNSLNEWFILKCTQMNDWIVSTRFSSRWLFLNTFITGVIGISSKFWANYLNKSEVHNVANLLELLKNRPSGTPLITVCNHDSCCDDPLVFGASMPISSFFFNLKNFRWTLGAKDVCFNQPLHSLFFRLGQVLPVVRGGGIYQPIMNEVLDRLNSGSWLHIFPEGKVNMEKEFMRLKWGVGRLIADATKTPIVLPFMHYGMETILPNYPPYIPQTKKKNNNRIW